MSKARAHARSLSATLPISRCRARGGPFCAALGIAEAPAKARRGSGVGKQGSAGSASKAPDRSPLPRGRRSGPAGQGSRAVEGTTSGVPETIKQLPNSLFLILRWWQRKSVEMLHERGREKDKPLTVFLFRQKPGCCPGWLSASGRPPVKRGRRQSNDSASGRWGKEKLPCEPAQPMSTISSLAKPSHCIASMHTRPGTWHLQPAGEHEERASDFSNSPTLINGPSASDFIQQLPASLHRTPEQLQAAKVCNQGCISLLA